ncbi:hypothetical protein ABZX77_14275 [Streptomyces sp. NPDC004237]|uniref:hypothetical protein n=1 Tax=Streptomyces sp. NPDC004237 TaxID=3154455 RepID=UPI0033AF4D71
MSDTFLLAARIPMSREGFEAWLSTPTPGLSRIANPADMFDGWFWNGSRADQKWGGMDGGITPREFFSAAIDGTCSDESGDGCILLHRDGAMEAYLYHFGYRERSVHTALLMFAAAGEFKSEAAEDTVLFWAETGGNLWDADDDGWLAVLSVGKSEARFVSERDLTDTVAGLRPVESRFFDMIERLGEEEESWDWESGRDFHTDTPRDPAFVDPLVLAE